MTRARSFLSLILILSLTLAGLVLAGRQQSERWNRSLGAPLRGLAARLGLTDLALWTEARYTRHPSQADRFTAFQDLPGAFDHFPAGSIIIPPATLPSR